MALSPADADIARRDTVIPGLATVLDSEAFTTALEKHLPGIELESVESTYIRYKSGTSCLVSYTLRAGGGIEARAYAKAHGPDVGTKLRKAREKPGVAGKLGAGRLALGEAGVIVSFFPNDGKLKALGRLADSGDTRKLLKDLFPERPELHAGVLHTLRYKPERRYVARLVIGERTAATVKLYTESDYRAVKSATEAFAGVPGGPGSVRLPHVIGRSDGFHAVAFEWQEGLPLCEAGPETGEAVGAALAGLHACDLDGSSGKLEHVTRQEEANELLALASGVGFTCPPLSRMVHGVAAGLSARILDEPPVCRPTHGDFYDEQVLLSGGHAVILDLDRAARRDPAFDLGNFIAHLERDVLLGEISRTRARALGDGLLRGYRTATGEPVPERIKLYTAVGLLKLAPEPFRRREPDWPDRTRMILERVQEVLPGTALAS